MAAIDAIVYWPTDKAYFFRGSNYVRYRLGGGEGAEEKVSLTEHRWKGLAFEDKIDAAATVEPHGAVYFFRDDLFIPYRISPNPDEEGALDQPRPIVERFSLLPPEYQSKLDEVLYWPRNGRLYFFKENRYLACEPVSGAPLQAERLLPGGWKGLPFDRIDAAFVGKRDKAYFFRGEEYVVYSISADKATGPPRPWKDHWPAQRSRPGEKTLWELLSESGQAITDDMIVEKAKLERNNAMMKAGSELMALEAKLAAGMKPDPNDRVVKAVHQWLLVPPSDRRFAKTVRAAAELVNRNILIKTTITIDRSLKTDYAHVRAIGDPSKGIVIEDQFFTIANSQCQREVLTHEFFHLSGLVHFYGTTKPAEAIRCPHHLAELVFDIATGQTLGCSKPPITCVSPLP